MNDIKLTFINNSNDGARANVLFFQKTAKQKFDELAVAWKVMKDCSSTDNHPFSFPSGVSLIATDNQGRNSAPYLTQTGQLLQVQALSSGLEISQRGPASNPKELQVQNDLANDQISLSLFKDGHLLARRSAITPGQTAGFNLSPTLWATVADNIEEGQLFDPAKLKQAPPELRLEGTATSNIIMTGGGPGEDALPFVFNLERVAMT